MPEGPRGEAPADAIGLMAGCIFDDDPCLFIENMPSYWNPGEAPVPGQRIPLGKARIVKKGAPPTPQMAIEEAQLIRQTVTEAQHAPIERSTT